MIPPSSSNQTASPTAMLRASAQRAAVASTELAVASTDTKNQAICAVIDLLDQARDEIQQANDKDMDQARTDGLADTLVARLKFGRDKIDSRIAALRDMAALPDPVGQPVDAWRTANGLDVQRVRSPLGVILMIYEARPHVTLNAAALCLKAGNAAILRGGREAGHTNAVLGRLWTTALQEANLPRDSVQVIRCSRDQVAELLQWSDVIDLVIPRGGKGLIKAVSEQSKIPVLKHEDGICHVYLDAPGSIEAGIAITLDSKTLMPQVCNAAETLLVHRDHAEALPQIVQALQDAGVTVRGCGMTQSRAPEVEAATDEDWATEYLGMTISLRVVDDVEQAIDHIMEYGSKHTDAIVTDSLTHADQFTRRLDSAVTLVNASTMFDDGQTLGMGAEIGIATGKLHARGPMGAEALTIPRLVLHGSGQTMGS